MPSLSLGNYSEYFTAGDQIDYLEVRSGESYVVQFQISDNQTPPSPIDITEWTFTTTIDSYTACFQYGGDTLKAVSNFTEQGSQPTVAGLEAFIGDALTGQGTLTVPAQATTLPAGNITADGDNTLLNVVTITASYPTSVPGFTATRKLLIGLIIKI
jgi:hypothetical protein